MMNKIERVIELGQKIARLREELYQREAELAQLVGGQDSYPHTIATDEVAATLPFEPEQPREERVQANLVAKKTRPKGYKRAPTSPLTQALVSYAEKHKGETMTLDQACRVAGATAKRPTVAAAIFRLRWRAIARGRYQLPA